MTQPRTTITLRSLHGSFDAGQYNLTLSGIQNNNGQDDKPPRARREDRRGSAEECDCPDGDGMGPGQVAAGHAFVGGNLSFENLPYTGPSDYLFGK